MRENPRAQRALGILFVRMRTTQIDEHALAPICGHQPVALGDGLGEAVAMAADHGTQIFGIESRRAREAAEHRRQPPMLGVVSPR